MFEIQEKPDPGIVVFKNTFPEAKDLILAAEFENRWRQGSVFARDAASVESQHRQTLITDISRDDYPQEWNQKAHTAITQGLLQYLNEMGVTGHHIAVKDEGFQLLKYAPGGFYKSHVDGWTASHRQISVILYLNGDFEGGGLYFKKQNYLLKPEAGLMVFFPSNYVYPHAALPCKGGIKYCLVTFIQVLSAHAKNNRLESPAPAKERDVRAG